MDGHGRAAYPDIERLIDQAWRMRHDDSRAARGAALRALALAQARPDPLGEAWAQLRLAVCDLIQARPDDDGLARLEWVIAAMRSLQDARGEAEALNLMGNIANDRLDHEAALVHYACCQALREGLGDTAGVAAVINNRAIALRLLGRLDEAHDLLHAALRPTAGAPDTVSVGYLRLNLGHVELYRRRVDAAALHLEQAFTAASRTDDRALECSALTVLAEVRVAQQRHDEAGELLANAHALALRTGNVGDAGRVNLAQARLETSRNRIDVAEAHLHAALDAARRADDRVLAREVQEAFDRLAVAN